MPVFWIVQKGYVPTEISSMCNKEYQSSSTHYLKVKVKVSDRMTERRNDRQLYI